MPLSAHPAPSPSMGRRACANQNLTPHTCVSVLPRRSTAQRQTCPSGRSRWTRGVRFGATLRTDRRGRTRRPLRACPLLSLLLDCRRPPCLPASAPSLPPSLPPSLSCCWDRRQRTRRHIQRRVSPSRIAVASAASGLGVVSAASHVGRCQASLPIAGSLHPHSHPTPPPHPTPNAPIVHRPSQTKILPPPCA